MLISESVFANVQERMMTAKYLKKFTPCLQMTLSLSCAKKHLLQIELNESLNSDSPIIKIF